MKENKFNKIISFVLLVLISFSLVSCKDKENDVDKNEEQLPRLAEIFIEEINKINTVSLDSKQQLDLSIILYTCLQDTYIECLDNERVGAAKEKLDSFITEYNSLKLSDYNKEKNEQLKELFINSVNELPEKDLIILDDISKIIQAESNYNYLSSELKKDSKVVEAKELLDSIRNEYDLINSLSVDEYNARKFIIGVTNLPNIADLTIKDIVDFTSLKELYNSLSGELKNSANVAEALIKFNSYESKINELQTSQEKASSFIMTVFSLPTGSALKYQNLEQKNQIEEALNSYNNLTEFEKSIDGVEEAYQELNVIKTQFENLKEPYNISLIKPTHLCFYIPQLQKLSFDSGKDPYTILINNYGLTKETIAENVKIYLDVYIEGGAVKGSPLFKVDITNSYNVTLNDVISTLNQLKAEGNESIKTQGYTFTIHIESLNEEYASSEYSDFFSAMNISIQ